MSDLKVLLLDENRGFGGAERHVVDLASQFAEMGVLAGVVGRPDSWLKEACQERRLPFHDCGFRNEIDMFSVFGLWREIKNSGAGVVHCIAHRDLVAVSLALQLPSAPAVRLVKAEHSFPDPNLSPLFRWAYRRCHRVACVSRSLEKAFREAVWSGPDQLPPTALVSNGIALGPFPTEQPPNDPLHIGVLSALREGKGQADFLQAAARWRAQSEIPVRLSLAGEGPERDRLEQLARDLEVKCEFLGHQDDPMAYLSQLDLCVVPSHKETFCLVALEALVSGVPLLAADSDGVSELYPHPDRLYPRGDFIALAEALKRFAERPLEYRERALRLASEYRERFSLEAMANQYLALYREITL